VYEEQNEFMDRWEEEGWIHVKSVKNDLNYTLLAYCNYAILKNLRRLGRARTIPSIKVKKKPDPLYNKVRSS